MHANPTNNLPDPERDDDGDNTYVQRNIPAAGNLFKMFDFGHRAEKDIKARLGRTNRHWASALARCGFQRVKSQQEG